MHVVQRYVPKDYSSVLEYIDSYGGKQLTGGYRAGN